MAAFELERCYSCKKLFCCEDCCVNHVRTKHPSREFNCPLCRHEPLIVRNFDYEQLLCHVVFNHLPLNCRTCGELFENAEDLKAIGKCGYHPLIRVEPPTFIESIRSTSSIYTPSPLNKTPHPSSIDQKGMSIGGDYNCNFDDFTSPPELSRGTSTPMHIGIMRKNHNYQCKTIPKIPNVIYTTPSFSIENNSEKRNVSVGTPKSYLNEAESVYYSGQSSVKSNASFDTPLKSILSMKSTSTEIHQQHDLSKKFSERKLPSMEELDEDAIDMELTNAVGAIFTENVTPPTTDDVSKHLQFKDSAKKVRFIDQLDEETKSGNPCDVSEIEEFFEAPQSFSEMSVNFPQDVNMNRSIVKIFDGRHCENEEKKVNDDDGHEHKGKNENQEFPRDQTPKSESTSRIVMMVLVEQTNDNEPTDLAPLIDSGLKKLGSVLSKSVSFQKDSSNPTTHEVENVGKFSMISVDSYTSVSTVECFKASDIETIPQKNRSITSNINLTGTGILSAVANAVKSAFRNFSGVTLTKSPNTGATSSQEIPQLPSTSLPNTSDKSSEKGITANSTMNSSSRPGKRSREEVDPVSLELPEVSNIEAERGDNRNDIRSPLQKRPRGWYRQIRGREPIARMKSSFSSPRGISSERQCFQQGSLTVGDTVVPLPSRAHQSTQTD